MGAWDVDAFGNDTALDWAYGLEQSEDLSLLEQTLQTVLDAGEDYLEAPEAEEGLAAAEVVARLLGNWGVRNAYTEAVDAWVTGIGLKPGPDLLEMARAAVSRVMAWPSELLELWQDSDALADWQAAVLDLSARLGEE